MAMDPSTALLIANLTNRGVQGGPGANNGGAFPGGQQGQQGAMAPTMSPLAGTGRPNPSLNELIGLIQGFHKPFDQRLLHQNQSYFDFPLGDVNPLVSQPWSEDTVFPHPSMVGSAFFPAMYEGGFTRQGSPNTAEYTENNTNIGGHMALQMPYMWGSGAPWPGGAQPPTTSPQFGGMMGGVPQGGQGQLGQGRLGGLMGALMSGAGRQGGQGGMVPRMAPMGGLRPQGTRGANFPRGGNVTTQPLGTPPGRFAPTTRKLDQTFTNLMPGDKEGSREILQFAQNAPGGMGQFLTAWQNETDPVARTRKYQTAKGLISSLKSKGLEGTRQLMMQNLKPTETQFGSSLSMGGFSPIQSSFGTGRVSSAGDIDRAREQIAMQQQMFKSLLGNQQYNTLLGG